MQIAIFVSTPYQILVALQLSKTVLKNKSIDLYVLNHFENAHQLYERIRGLSYFENVYYSEVKKIRDLSLENNKYKRAFKLGSVFNNYKKIAEDYFCFDNKKYKQVFLSYPDTIIQVAIRYLKDINPNIIVNYFEDGIGSYITNIFVRSKKRDIFNHLFGYSNLLNKNSKLFLFSPTLFSGELPKGMEIIGIPHINLDDKSLIKDINYIFNVKDNIDEPENILYFEQPMDGPNIKIDKKIANLIKQVNESFQLSVKMHPRSNNEILYEGVEILSTNNIPWEIFAMNTNIEEKILLAYNSTTLVTNKMLFNQEPTIVFLYEMNELAEYRKIFPDMSSLVLDLKNLYIDSSRIKLPKNLHELEKIIDKSK